MSVSLLGVSVFQRLAGCEWDEETEELTGFLKYGYDGEDLIKFEPKTKEWVLLNPQADFIKQSWDDDPKDKDFNYDMITTYCHMWLNKSLDVGKSTLLRTGRYIM